MVSSSVFPLSQPPIQFSSTNFTVPEKPIKSQTKLTKSFKEPIPLSTSRPSIYFPILHKSLPLAASLVILLSSNPARAGLLSGSSGIESVPGPELPQIDFLNKFNEENQKKYAENDARFKESPILKQLLEKSKLNKEKNRLETQDKYCIRGAEWGVGDCSAEGMSPQDRDNFISSLKQKSTFKGD
ncbi:hypothetical protein UlMin_041086 [Ulmus minor]